MTGTSKQGLRQDALARRTAIDPAVRTAFAERLALAGVDLARRAMASVVGAYWPLAGEADTTWLLQALDYHQFAVALPASEGRDRPLVFRLWTPRDRLTPGPHGVMEPSARARVARPDLLFVPLAAFDRRGHRLGYGAGYYDRTLHALRAAKPVLAVGVAFAAQEVASVPDEPHDHPLDLVLTETDLIDCRTD